MFYLLSQIYRELLQKPISARIKPCGGSATLPFFSIASVLMEADSIYLTELLSRPLIIVGEMKSPENMMATSLQELLATDYSDFHGLLI
ncbi:MAG: hypothetical protein ACI8P3_002504 [Saprospiraceae bacterium]|jgi:hypothetical protein